MHSKEIQNSLAEQANSKWREARECAVGVERMSVKGLNALREIGIMLGSNWRSVQSELEFGEQEVQMCLTFARKHPEPVVEAARAIRLLDEIRMTTGLLAFSTHGPQQLHSPNFFSVISKQMVAFRSECKKQLSRSPFDQWEQPALEQFVYQIEPYIEELNGIYTKAKAQLSREQPSFLGPSSALTPTGFR